MIPVSTLSGKRTIKLNRPYQSLNPREHSVRCSNKVNRMCSFSLLLCNDCLIWKQCIFWEEGTRRAKRNENIIREAFERKTITHFVHESLSFNLFFLWYEIKSKQPSGIWVKLNELSREVLCLVSKRHDQYWKPITIRFFMCLLLLRG